MKIYLAAAWGTQVEMRAMRDRLYKIGHRVISRWIDLPVEIGVKPEDMTRDVAHHGRTDLEDIDAAHCLVVFTEVPSTTGGYIHEFGYAMAQHKYLVVVGKPLNIFMTMPSVVHVSSGEGLLKYLSLPLFPPEAYSDLQKRTWYAG